MDGTRVGGSEPPFPSERPVSDAAAASEQVIEVTLDGFDELMLVSAATPDAEADAVIAAESFDIESIIRVESPAWCESLAVFDLETTGIDIETSRIVSAHVGVIDGAGHPVEGRSWLADPGVEIPDGAVAVHGISTERARAEGRRAAEVVAEILEALREVLGRGLPLTIYNAPYDLSLLNREALRHGLEPLIDPSPVIDPLVIDKAMDRYRPGKRTLVAASRQYGVLLDDAHDSRADAIAAGRVAQAVARRYPAELGMDIETLHLAQVGWCADQAERFQDYMRRERDPGFAADGSWPQR